MKQIRIILVSFLILAGCAKTPLAETPAPEAVSPPSPVVNSGIGTEGGGGTLVFAFRQGAMSAKRTMERVRDLEIQDPTQDGLNLFYRAHRDRWIHALEHFVLNSEMVVEVNEPLLENDVLVGAKSEPASAPTKVRLSVPYLSGKEGFTSSKAFALAVHEAGHFAKPDISRAEHPYLDQIANLLFWRRGEAKLEKELRFRLDFYLGYSGVHLASDNRTLMMRTRNHELLTLDTESGLRLVEKGPQIVHRDWIEMRVGDKAQLRNQITRETIGVDLPEGYYVSGILGDERTVVLHKSARENQPGSLILRNFRTGEEERIATLPRVHFGSTFSDGYKMEIQAGVHGAVIFDLQKQEVLDLVREKGAPFGSHFVSNKLALVYWWTNHLRDFDYHLRRIGDKTLDIFEARHYLGQWEKKLVFSRSHLAREGAGILYYDLESGEQKFVSLPKLEKVERFGALSQAVLRHQDGSLWAADLADPEKSVRVSAEKRKEDVQGTYSTPEGRVLITQDTESNTLIVRFLDRGEK